VDEDDEESYEPEDEVFIEQVTERVRIIGADPVGPASDLTGRPAPPPASSGDDRERDRGAWGPDTGPRRPFSTWLEDDTDAMAGTSSTTDLPHWSDPPTGQVPAVLDRRGEPGGEGGSWSASGGTGPTWRERTHEWDEGGFEPAALADESTRVGALDEIPLEARQPWEFEDLGTPPGGTSSVARTPARRRAVAEAPNEGSIERSAVASPARSSPSSSSSSGSPGEEPIEPARVSAVGNGVPSISSSPLRGPAEPLSPVSAPGTRRRHRRSPESPGGGAGRNVPVSIATGLGLAAVAIACFELGSVASLVLATIVVTLAAAEVYAAFRRAGRHPATLLGLVATAAVVVAAYAKGVAALPLVSALLIITAMVWYLVGAERGSPVGGISSTVLGFAWVGLLGSFAGLLLAPSLYPERHGIAFFFGAVAATVGADVGALAIGAWRGRHPLAPSVSPHKTWEGAIGGAVLAVLVSAAITGQIHPWTPAKAAVLGLVVAVLAPVGDLCESLIKRDLGLKDMGSLLPGHGGLLDRVDGLLFVLPATYYLVRVLHLG
jgi:phosphatidate cytidylyltransferase